MSKLEVKLEDDKKLCALMLREIARCGTIALKCVKTKAKCFIGAHAASFQETHSMKNGSWKIKISHGHYAIVTKIRMMRTKSMLSGCADMLVCRKGCLQHEHANEKIAKVTDGR